MEHNPNLMITYCETCSSNPNDTTTQILILLCRMGSASAKVCSMVAVVRPDVNQMAEKSIKSNLVPQGTQRQSNLINAKGFLPRKTGTAPAIKLMEVTHGQTSGMMWAEAVSIHVRLAHPHHCRWLLTCLSLSLSARRSVPGA